MRFSVNRGGAPVGRWLVGSSFLIFLAAAPADKVNLPGQHRTRTCVKMMTPVVPLRFADGKPTGFFVRADDPSTQGGKRPCSAGFMEIDAREMLTTASGATLYFHPGGGGDLYKDSEEDGQYGHIAVTDLAELPKLKRSKNGKPAALSGAAYYIAPTRIPHDMWYKAEVVDGHSGASYANYGNPGYDKTDGRGDWTYITWSWVQNGGKKYPDNINGGGGIVRALGKRDMRFAAAAVEQIIGYSYGADNRANGRVTVIYGSTHTGPGEGGSSIYGWLAHSYQRQNEPIVPCVRRAEPTIDKSMAETATAGLKDSDPMVRMASNLLFERKVDDATAENLRAEWTKRLADEKAPFARMEILTEMSRVDSAQTIGDMLGALDKEQAPRVREQIILLLPYMRSTAANMKVVGEALLQDFRRSKVERERLRIIEAAAIIPTHESVLLVREIARTLSPTDPDVELHFAVADTVHRLMPRMKADDDFVKQVVRELEDVARRGTFQMRLRAIRILSAPEWNERSFLSTLSGSETSPDIRSFISKVNASPQNAR